MLRTKCELRCVNLYFEMIYRALNHKITTGSVSVIWASSVSSASSSNQTPRHAVTRDSGLEAGEQQYMGYQRFSLVSWILAITRGRRKCSISHGVSRLSTL